MLFNPSFYLPAEHGKDGGSQDEKHCLEFEAICCDGVNLFGQESFDLATCSFDSFPIGGQQVAQPSGV